MRPGKLVILLAGLLAGPVSAQEPEPKDAPAPLPEPKVEVIEIAAVNGSVSPSGVYARIEWLFWNIKDAPLPVPLLTAGAVNPQVLIGNEDIEMGQRRGTRITVGGWEDSDEMEGIEATFLYLSSGPVRRALVDTTGSLRLANPFINALTGRLDSNPLSVPPQPITFIDQFGNVVVLPQVVFPGLAAGVKFESRSELFGFEGSGMMAALREGDLRADVLGGFRYFGLREQLTMNSFSVRIPRIPGDVYDLHESFKTQSHFFGPQIGARASWNGGWWSADLQAKLAIGPMVQVTQIDGSLNTNIFAPNLRAPVAENSGAIYAQDSNQGGSYVVRFAIIPEVQGTIGIHFTSWLRGFAGYSAMYVNTVARPGQQIDPRINTNQSPALPFAPRPAGPLMGPPLPGQPDVSNSFWAHGLSLGFELLF